MAPTMGTERIEFYLNQVPQRGSLTLAENCLEFYSPISVFSSGDKVKDSSVKLTAMLASLPRKHGIPSPPCMVLSLEVIRKEKLSFGTTSLPIEFMYTILQTLPEALLSLTQI